jgi:ribonuclease Z
MVEKINLTFLGTGSAVPTKKRNHPSILIKYKQDNFLFDCGEGTQRQFRKAELNPCKINKIFITHWHGDHIFGLPGLFQTLILNEYNQELEIYGPRGTKKYIELIQNLCSNKEKLKLKIHEIEKGKIFENKELSIEAKPMQHKTPCVAYSFIIKEKNRINKEKLEKLKLPKTPLIAELLKGKKVKINGKVINGKSLIYKEPQRKITLITDTIENPGAVEIAKNSDILICESTFSSNEKEEAKEHNHMTSEQSAKLAKKSKSKQLYLIHLSQRYSKNYEQIGQEAKKIFKNTIIPNDLDFLTI